MQSSTSFYPTAIEPSPNHIEQSFPFLDLPPEIRNMIYEFSFESSRFRDSDNWDCTSFFTSPCLAYYKAMQLQWSPPLLAFVSKSVRQEIMTLYYATTEFDWHWDPTRVHSEHLKYPLTRPLQLLNQALDFVASHNTQIKSITVGSPNYHCHQPTNTMVDITNSMRFLAPLSKSLKETGRAHPALRQIHFADESSLAYRLFDHASSIEPSVLDDEKALDSAMRVWLSKDPGASELSAAIKYGEEYAIALHEATMRLEKQRRQQTIKMYEQEQHRIKMDRRWRAKQRRINSSVLVPIKRPTRF